MIFKTVSTLLCSILLIFCLACGQTYEMQSIEMTPATPNLTGVGSSQQFLVVAKYSNGKTQDFTTRVTYTLDAPTGPVIAPATAVDLTQSGRLQVISSACTFAPNTNVAYPYVITAKFDTFTSRAFVNVNALTGCNASTGSNGEIRYVLPGESE